jgi:hypothetical protein
MANASHYSPMEAYAQSKLANIYFGQWLAEKERSAHPKVPACCFWPAQSRL